MENSDLLRGIAFCQPGFAGFFTPWSHQHLPWRLFTFAFMLGLGLKIPCSSQNSVPQTSSFETKFGKKLNPALGLRHRASCASWGIPACSSFGSSSPLISIDHDWVTQDWTVQGRVRLWEVALGTGAWFIGLSYAVSLGHGEIQRPEHCCGWRRVSGSVSWASLSIPRPPDCLPGRCSIITSEPPCWRRASCLPWSRGASSARRKKRHTAEVLASRCHRMHHQAGRRSPLVPPN